MKKGLIAIAIAAVVSTAAIIGISQKAGGDDHGKRGFGHRGGPMMGMGLRGVDLTDDQKAMVKSIFTASRETTKPLMADLRANHKKLADLNANGFDEAGTTALANEQAQIMAKLVVERERTKSQIFALLTDEQKAKAAEMRTQFKDKMKDRFKRHASDGEKPAGF